MYTDIENKIVIFAVNEALANSAIKVVNSLGLNIEVDIVSYENYLIKAEEYKLMNKEIIIARGIIADSIRANVDINVINIDINFEDVIKLLCESTNTKKKIAICISDIKLSNSIFQIGKLIGLDIYNYANPDLVVKYEKGANIDEIFNEAIENMKSNGIEVIISMSFGKRDTIISESLGIEFKAVDSGTAAVTEAVKKAYDLYEMTMKERTEKEKFKTILDHSTEGIMAIELNGVITTFNNLCEKYFNRNGTEIIGNHIEDIFPEFPKLELISNNSVINEIFSINGEQLICDFIPVKVHGQMQCVVVCVRKINEVNKAEQEIRMYSAKTNFNAKSTFDNLIGKSNSMKETIKLAKVYSEVSSTILITGESGTGKEVLAQAIHNHSPRKNCPFVPINCAALPPNLLESELFGYTEGAFTGSRKGGKQGLFELAHNGTIFLDEIGDTDLSLQAKILRVIQEKQILRIGDNKMIPINVRVISATNKNLFEEVQKNHFRLDLFYRLNVLELNLCPLKERKEDLPDLVNEIILQLNSELNFRVTGLDSKIFEVFFNHSWPGNIRELRNVLERLVVLTRTGLVKFENVRDSLSRFALENDKIPSKNNYIDLNDSEKNLILEIYQKEGYNKQRAATKLGISRNTLKRKLAKYDIE